MQTVQFFDVSLLCFWPKQKNWITNRNPCRVFVVVILGEKNRPFAWFAGDYAWVETISRVFIAQICEKLCIWIKVIVIDIGSEWRQKTEQKQWLKFSLYTHTNSSRYLSFNLFTLIRIYGSAYMHRVCLERIELFNLQCVSAWTFKSTLWRYFRSNKQFAVRFECKEKLQTEYRETLCNHNCCTTEQINR